LISVFTLLCVDWKNDHADTYTLRARFEASFLPVQSAFDDKLMRKIALRLYGTAHKTTIGDRPQFLELFEPGGANQLFNNKSVFYKSGKWDIKLVKLQQIIRKNYERKTNSTPPPRLP
jgi:hypothetical protein